MSPNAGPKPTHQSRSKSISRVLLQLSPVSPFHFRPTLKIKSSSHKKKFTISVFSKMVQTILIKFCGFIAHSKYKNMTLSAFPGKIHETEKKKKKSV